MMRVSIKAMRVNSNLLQSDVAARMGVRRETIHSWESGRTSPTAVQLAELCGIYGCSMGDIFFPEKLTER